MTKPTIIVAGASGFVGCWVIEQLKHDFHIIGLSRGNIKKTDANIEWRSVDLFSASSTQDALLNCDYAIYLVHSMLPSTRLSQGSFENNDLIIADNFAIACQKNNVKQIIYLSGIIPKQDNLSEHLQSRYEVEQVLSSKGTPVTTLRAGMVVGPNGSSFRIMENLLKRLPVMILPAWTKTPSQAVSIDRVIKSIDSVLTNEDWFNKSIDLGCGETLSYSDMLKRAAKHLKLARLFISVPIKSTSFSKLWVSVVSQTPIELTSPLIDSLTYPIIPDLSNMKALGTFKNESFEDLLAQALKPCPLPKIVRNGNKVLKENNVRSIQRLASFPNNDANWIADQYLSWLPHFFKYIIRVEVKNEIAYFKSFGIKLLELTWVKERSTPDRHLFFITGGVLCKRKDHGWLEFRQVFNKKWTLAAIHEFVPTLPWWLYRLTQAPIHAFVMYKFGKHLERIKTI